MLTHVGALMDYAGLNDVDDRLLSAESTGRQSRTSNVEHRTVWDVSLISTDVAHISYLIGRGSSCSSVERAWAWVE